MALIILLTIVVLGMTTLLVTQLTPNARKTIHATDNAAVLAHVSEALTGFSLRHSVPGVLPCPDTTGDGLENPSAGGCIDQLGLIPYQTLEIDQLTDVSGAPLWYAVSLNFVAATAGVKNVSRPSTLTVDGVPAAAVVIAPGLAVDGQARSSLVANNYLEGINADGNRDDYETTTGVLQNDQLLPVRLSTHWKLVESIVAVRAEELLNSYRVNCGEYPWAAAFNGTPDSVVNAQSGRLPLGTALPFDWGAPCGMSFAPAPDLWLAVHWQDQLYYRFCTALEASCITVIDGEVTPVPGVLITPGTTLVGQSRPSGNLSDYFEAQNSDADDTEFRYLPVFDHSTIFNDTVFPLP